MAKSEPNIPQNLQPRAADYRFDLEGALRSVVGLRADVPGDAFTAGALGTERAGNGICIRGGLILTMAYLIMESESIWLTTADGWAVPGHALAVDFETGFGLVQPLGKLGIDEMAIGDSNAVQVGWRAASHDRDPGGGSAGVRRLLGVSDRRCAVHRAGAPVLGRRRADWA
jgi:S1-C subfamily serine protease